MKNLFLALVFILLCVSCLKNEFDIANPDVGKFVQQLKEDSYNQYVLGEDGEKLWLKMPEFSKEHISSLLGYAKDTSQINKFPLNPISSGVPFPYDRQYIILGECLLWTIEGIRSDSLYGSLNPVLLESTSDGGLKGLKGEEILKVRDIYFEWWTENRNDAWQEINPLEGTPYAWY